jgi:hypothetical protein
MPRVLLLVATIALAIFLAPATPIAHAQAVYGCPPCTAADLAALNLRPGDLPARYAPANVTQAPPQVITGAIASQTATWGVAGDGVGALRSDLGSYETDGDAATQLTRYAALFAPHTNGQDWEPIAGLGLGDQEYVVQDIAALPLQSISYAFYHEGVFAAVSVTSDDAWNDIAPAVLAIDARIAALTR